MTDEILPARVDGAHRHRMGARPLRRRVAQLRTVARRPGLLVDFARFRLGRLRHGGATRVDGRYLVRFADFREYRGLAATLPSPAEAAFVRAVHAAGGPGGVYLDVGANLGQFTSLFAALPGAQVFALEADPRTAHRLAATLASNGIANAVVANLAAAGASGARVAISDGPVSYMNRVRPDTDADPGAATARTVAVDDFIRARGLSDIRLVKIDVEGDEPAALAGLADSIRAGLVHTLLMEWYPPNLVGNDRAPEELLALLDRLDLDVFEVAGGGRLVPAARDELLAARRPRNLLARRRTAAAAAAADADRPCGSRAEGPGRPDPSAADVAVVIPTHNRAAHLARLIESLSAQRHVAEIIVCDDASSDDTPAVAARLPGVRLIRSETNIGPSAMRNRGAAAATAPLVAFVDDDCTFDDPDTLAVVRRRLLEQQAAAVAMPYLNANRPGREVVQIAPPGGSVTLSTFACALLVRRDVFLDVGGFRDVLFMQMEESDLAIRLIDRGQRILAVDAPPLLHHEPLFGEKVRIRTIAPRNQVIFTLANVPFPEVLAHLAVMSRNLLVHALRRGQLRETLRGAGEALRLWHAGAFRREPVAHRAYRVFRRLRRAERGGALRSLHPTAAPAPATTDSAHPAS